MATKGSCQTHRGEATGAMKVSKLTAEHGTWELGTLVEAAETRRIGNNAWKVCQEAKRNDDPIETRQLDNEISASK